MILKKLMWDLTMALNSPLSKLMLNQNVPAGPAFSVAEYDLFSQRVQMSLGIRLVEYKPDQMRRRLTTIATQTGCNSFLTYFAEIQKSELVKKAFLDHMTINVTELMRNTDLFDTLAKKILPELIKNSGPAGISIWSAGCSYGAEAYTVSMLLNEMVPLPIFKVRGTDIDYGALNKANSAMFGKADMVGVEVARRKRHFMEVGDDTFIPMPALRKNVSFGPHDLLGTEYAAESYDLILCRNVVIYFNDDAKERIYQNFWKALKPGGVLFVGGTERLSNNSAKNYESICPFFYRAKKSKGAPALGQAA